MKFDKKVLRNIFLVAAGCIVLYWLLHEADRVEAVFGIIRGIVAPFLSGLAIAFVANVPMRAIENGLGKIKKASLRRVVSLVLTLIAILLVLALVFWLLIPQLVETIESLIPKLQIFLQNIEDGILEFVAQNPEVLKWITTNTNFGNIDWAGLLQNTLKLAGNSATTILSGAFNAIGSVASAAVDLFIAVVFAIYCLFQKETLARQCRKLLYAFVPEKYSDGIVRILRLSNTTFSNFLSGQCLEVCILGGLFAIAMAIFRMPYIPLVSVLIAVTAFVPIVGAWIGCILGTFLMLVNDPMQAVWFLVLFFVLQQIENNLIYPRVVGNSIGLSGMWVLVAIAVGGELMGVAGMLILIPVTSVVFTLLSERTRIRLAERQIDPAKLEPQPLEFMSRFRENQKMRRLKRKQKATDSKRSKK